MRLNHHEHFSSDYEAWLQFRLIALRKQTPRRFAWLVKSLTAPCSGEHGSNHEGDGVRERRVEPSLHRRLLGTELICVIDPIMLRPEPVRLNLIDPMTEILCHHTAIVSERFRCHRDHRWPRI